MSNDTIAGTFRPNDGLSANAHTPDARRAEVVQGLRELAQFFEDHPEMPLPYIPEFRHCVHAPDDAAGMAKLKHIAETLGVDISGAGSPGVIRKFAGLTYEAFYVPKERMRQYAAYSSYAGAVEPDEPQGGAE